MMGSVFFCFCVVCFCVGDAFRFWIVLSTTSLIVAAGTRVEGSLCALFDGFSFSFFGMHDAVDYWSVCML